MAKDSFIFYRSFYDSIKKLKKNDQLTIYSHICKYALGEKVEELEGVPSAIFDLIKPQIDANLTRYENGKKGGRPVTKTKPNENQTETKAKRNVNVNVNGNENVNVNGNGNVNVNAVNGTETTTTTTAPTLPEINNYCKQNGILTNTGKFYAYNEARNWNGHPERWQSMLQLWKEREREKEPAELRKYDFDELERILVNRG